MYSPEMSARIAEWRRKSLDGTLSIDEMKAAVVALREGRVSAAASSAKSRSAKAKAPARSADDMLAEL